MFSTRPNLLIPTLILLMSLPALSALLYFKYTGDPTLRPLSITFASLTEKKVGGSSGGITVQIDWGRNTRSPNTKAQVERALNKAMSVYPINFLVRLKETSGDRVQIYFLTGANRLGPFNLQNVSSGIPAALAAYQISTRNPP